MKKHEEEEGGMNYNYLDNNYWRTTNLETETSQEQTLQVSNSGDMNPLFYDNNYWKSSPNIDTDDIEI